MKPFLTALFTRAMAALLAVCCLPSYGQGAATNPEAAATAPAGKRFHVYLLMGQSNMAGRDTRGMDAQIANPRILSLDTNGQWIVAHDPLHPKIGRIEPGVGPGMSFAAEMLKPDPTVTIGLVPCAVGGTPLRRWVKGGDLYEKAVARAKIAAQAGVIKGVLWHQGESDTEKAKNAETYGKRLAQMFKDLRQDLGMPDLPIVVGQLGEFLSPKKYPYVNTVRAAIKNIPSMISNAGYADSAGLTDKGDKLHFTAGAQREFGRRYAKAMLELQKRNTATSASADFQTISPTAAAVVDVWPEGKMPGHGADAPEAERSPERTDAKRITNISHPTLTFFPVTNSAPVPAMIICPGGGYNYVVIDKEGTEIAAWLNSLGISALVLKYRTPQNRDGAFQDLQRALSLTRAHASGWHIDEKRLGVIGFSAGGNLAAKASTLFDRRSYAPVDATDQQSCRPDFAVLVYPAYLDDKKGGVSPGLNLKANIPPTLIVHTEDDANYVAGSKAYHAALDAAKVPNEFLLYPTGGHAYGLRSTKDVRVWPAAAAEWLRKMGV